MSIEEGTLTWLDENMYNNLPTFGVLEQYLEEKNLEKCLLDQSLDDSRVMIGVIIRRICAVIYIGLKIGLGIAAGMYVTCVIQDVPAMDALRSTSPCPLLRGTPHQQASCSSFPTIFLLAKRSGAYVTAEGP